MMRVAPSGSGKAAHSSSLNVVCNRWLSATTSSLMTSVEATWVRILLGCQRMAGKKKPSRPQARAKTKVRCKQAQATARVRSSVYCVPSAFGAPRCLLLLDSLALCRAEALLPDHRHHRRLSCRLLAWPAPVCREFVSGRPNSGATRALRPLCRAPLRPLTTEPLFMPPSKACCFC
jgi:hypothetical protein